jgi:hypothetical protein
VSEPKTAKQHNDQLTGDSYIVAAGSSSQTIASGMAQQLAWQREAEERAKIANVLRKFIQDELIIQQATAAIQKALQP